MIGLALAIQVAAQVIGVQPEPLGVYVWDPSADQYDKLANNYNLFPQQNTPEPIAFYGWNATLGQWTPCTAGGSCPNPFSANTISSISATLPIQVNGGQGPVTTGNANISCINGSCGGNGDLISQIQLPAGCSLTAAPFCAIMFPSSPAVLVPSSGSLTCSTNLAALLSAGQTAPFSASINRYYSSPLSCPSPVTATWVGSQSLPSGVLPANVTAVYAGFVSITTCSGGTTSTCGFWGQTVNGTPVQPAPDSWPLKTYISSALCTGSGCASFSYPTVTWVAQNASTLLWTLPGAYGGYGYFQPVLFVQYSTGPAPTVTNQIQVAAPLSYNQGVLSLPWPCDTNFDTGAVNAYAATIPCFNSLVPGVEAKIWPANTSTSTTPTFELNSFGNLTVEGPTGSALCAGDFSSLHEAVLLFDPDGKWRLLNPQVCGGGGSGVTWPASGDAVISNGTNTPTGLAPINGDCLVGSSGAWAVGGCGGTGGSPKVIYVSQIAGVTPGVAVSAGSSASGTVDSAGPINTAISGGGVDLEVDTGVALSTSIVLYPNTTVHCTAPQNGFIMQAASNAPVLVNAHQNAPTTSSGTGGFLVSNQADNNIRIIGCMLNANSVQAVTGSGNTAGTPHTTNPATGLMVNGVRFAGVNGLWFLYNETYDSGEWTGAISNSNNVYVDGNYFHQPTPMVQNKNTDGIDIIGPNYNVEYNSNIINSGDDAVAIASDGCWATSESDCQFTFWKSGWIQHLHAWHNILQAAAFGPRILSGTELVDDVTIGDTQGTTCGAAFSMDTISGLSTGNLGNISIPQWGVQTTGTCNFNSRPYNFVLGLTAKNISISAAKNTNPPVTWPMVTMLGSEGSIGTLDLSDWILTTSSSTFSNVVVLNGAVKNFKFIDDTWNDSVGTGSFISAGTSPTNVTCSGFVGRNLFAFGLSGSTYNGDCFAPIPNISIAVTGATQGANSCSSVSTATMNGLTTSGAGSHVTASYTGDPTSLTGWGSTGGMVFVSWPSAANTVSWKVCNQTTSSITYSSVTFSEGAQ